MKAARQNGKSGWNINVDGDQEKMEAKIELATKLSIERFQTLIQILVEMKDTRRLLALQSCTQELYRRADECLSVGKKMGISDSLPDGWN